MTDLVFQPATEQRRLLAERVISAAELLEAHLVQIDLANPSINAIVTSTAERAAADAAAADAAAAHGAVVGLLHGLPVAHKDLHDTAGIRTTYGSPLFADNVPERTALIVDRMWSAGAVCLGKTNTPEFGAGSQTYNEVFGATRNPFDTSLTCGGSSGGAAAALATGMIALADGSDYGASLRNPAAFCNVVGFRPTPGRVPTWPTLDPTWTGSVHGPMARTVDDVALLLAAVAGPDPRIPISIDEPPDVFAPPVSPAPPGTRIAWSADLGLPVHVDVLATLAPHVETLESLGFVVEEATPDLEGFDTVFMIRRFHKAAADLGGLVTAHRDRVKPEIVWTVERGFALDDEDIAEADRMSEVLASRAEAFFARHDYLMCPTTQVPPFPVEEHWVRTVAGREMEHFLAWLRSCYAISVLECPAISVPAGFTAAGLPVGLQIAGRRGDDLGVLRVAKAFEEATGYGRRHPPVAG